MKSTHFLALSVIFVGGCTSQTTKETPITQEVYEEVNLVSEEVVEDESQKLQLNLAKNGPFF